MRVVAIILSAIVVLASSPAGAQSGSAEPFESVEPSTATVAPATPVPGASVERPTLDQPLALPTGRKPVLVVGRAPDATVSRRGVRLDVWVPKGAIRTGRWVPATMRVTNLSGRPIKHYGQVGCDTGNDQLRFDFGGLFDAGKDWSGKAARFKKLFLAGSGLTSSSMRTVRPTRTDCVGSVGINEALATGRAFTVSKVALARYPWASQPLPGGKAEVTACYRFEFGPIDDDAPAADRYYDQCVSAPVRIKGRDVGYPSPQALTDAMLADPMFHTWVEDRKPNAMFHTSVDGPWKKLGYKGWAKDGYTGGPAPEELVGVSSQAGGKNGDHVSDLVIDAWTGQVLETTIVSGRREPPEGIYPTPSPSGAPAAGASPATTFEVFAESPTDALDTWGPLAVIEGGGGPDARTGHGTISIGIDCVTFTEDQTDDAVTLVWGSDLTSWRPQKRQVVSTDSPEGTTRLSGGDRVWFGGMAIAEEGESMEAWLEGVWVQRPDPSCPTDQWLVGDVNLLE